MEGVDGFGPVRGYTPKNTRRRFSLTGYELLSTTPFP